MIIHRKYTDLSPERRQEGARLARAHIAQALANPLLTPIQIKQLHAQLVKLDDWEAGTLHLPPVKAPQAPLPGSPAAAFIAKGGKPS